MEKKIIIGMPSDKKVTLKLEGTLGFEESLDMLNTAQFELLTSMSEMQPHLTKKMYERAVLGFSLMIDKFYPEGVETKFHGLTNEAIIKAQDDILKKRIKDKKNQEKDSKKQPVS